MTTKAVVMARGLGTRMRRADPAVRLSPKQAATADQGVKAMIAVARDRPFLDFVLSSLADAGLVDVCLVLGPEHGAIRRRYDEEIRPTRLAVSYAVQEKPLGTADAVLASRDFVGAESFVVVNADNLYPVDALKSLAEASPPALVGYDRTALIAKSNIDADRIERFAVLWATADNRLTRIVEKPDPSVAAVAPLVSMNSWHFTADIFRYCRAVRRSERGELELQDAVTDALRDGVAFHVVRCAEGVLDLSSRADVGRVAERLARVPVSL